MADNKLIGEIMVEMGLASRELIFECLNAQTEIHQRSANRIPLGTLLLKTGHITRDQLERALEKQGKYRLPS
jgi:hypothetical protein